MRVLVLRAPGTNCDQETAFAFQQAGGQAEVVHINRLLESKHLRRTIASDRACPAASATVTTLLRDVSSQVRSVTT